MKKLSKNLAMCICMFMAVFCAMTLRVEAANVTSGYLGADNGITWTYDADTKTLTITGEDSGLAGNRFSNTDSYQSLFVDICGDVEVIKLQNCKLKGSATGLFARLESLKRIEIDGFDTSEVTSMYDMFYNCEKLESLDVSGFNTSKVTNMTRMFSGCSSLRVLDVSGFDTSNVKSMKWMFSGVSVSELDVSNFNTSKVTDMSAMFNYCPALEKLDLSGFDTSSVTDMSWMFISCESLSELDLSGFELTNVTDMSRMFENCQNLKSISLGTFATPNLKYTSYMFYECSSLESLDLSAFDTSNVYDMSGMFRGCTNLKDLNISSFNTEKVKNMSYMFSGCTGLTDLDVSGFTTSGLTDIREMFYECMSLTSLDLSNFDLTKVTRANSVFSFCTNLAIIKTPAVIPETLSVYLGRDYVDLKNNRTTYLTKDFCDTTLINVNYLVTEIKLSDSSLAVNVGDSSQVNATLLPEKAVIKTVAWKSSNTAVATVDAKGKVTAVAPGTATITATATDGTGVSASCEVTVVQPVTGITLNETSLNLEPGGSAALTATVSPNNATNKAVTWKSSDTAVATVDANGKVTAVAPGTAVVTVTAADGNGASASSNVKVFSEQEWKIRAFVSRMYTVALGRAAEEDGLDFYVQRLLSGDSNGACIAESFLCSPEFLNKGHSDEEYVKVLYRTFFDREPAAEEVNYWVDKLSNGQTKSFVLSGFVNSVEFDNLCAQYGISRGFMREDGKPLNPGIGRFAERMYTVVLERAGEKEGIEYWSLSIANGVCTPKDAAKSFFLSQEYINKNTSDAQYITTLYKAFMDREPEAGGVEYWQNVLKNGATREQILEGFADSAEFKGIMASFGL